MNTPFDFSGIGSLPEYGFGSTSSGFGSFTASPFGFGGFTMPFDYGWNSQTTTTSKPKPKPPGNVNEFMALLIKEVLAKSNNADSLIAYVVNSKLPAGTKITSAGEGAHSSTFQDEFWFAYVDEDPFALFEHEVSYFLVNAETGKEIHKIEGWWPLLNGLDLWTEEENGNLSLARIYPVDNLWQNMPWQNAAADKIPQQISAPTGDYGDAPDDLDGYYGTTGRFPTLCAANNSRYNLPGAHTLDYNFLQ